VLRRACLQLLRVSAFIVVLLSIFIVVTLLASDALETYHPLAELSISRCGDAVCFMGIQPGKTTLDEARAIVLAHGGRVRTNDELVMNTGPYRVAISSFNGSPYITAISFVLDVEEQVVTSGATLNIGRYKQTNLRVDNFFAEFGPPCATTVTFAPFIELVYPDVHLQTYAVGQRLELTPRLLDSNIGTFSIREPNPALCDPKTAGRAVMWRGFASLDVYRRYGLSDN
jgi:hypothetical protein